MKTLNIFYFMIYWTQRYTMTAFLYIVSIAFRTCMDTSRKKFFWLRAQPIMHRLLHLFLRPESLASHRLFEQSKDMKVTGDEVWRVRRMWKTLEGQILGCCDSWTGRALSCWSKTPVFRHSCHLDLIAGHRWFFRSIYEGDSKSKGKIHLTAVMQVTVSNFTYYFST